MFNIFFCRWLDSNRGPLASEATTLPTEPQLQTNIYFGNLDVPEIKKPFPLMPCFTYAKMQSNTLLFFKQKCTLNLLIILVLKSLILPASEYEQMITSNRKKRFFLFVGKRDSLRRSGDLERCGSAHVPPINPGRYIFNHFLAQSPNCPEILTNWYPNLTWLCPSPRRPSGGIFSS